MIFPRSGGDYTSTRGKFPSAPFLPRRRACRSASSYAEEPQAAHGQTLRLRPALRKIDPGHPGVHVAHQLVWNGPRQLGGPLQQRPRRIPRPRPPPARRERRSHPAYTYPCTPGPRWGTPRRAPALPCGWTGFWDSRPHSPPAPPRSGSPAPAQLYGHSLPASPWAGCAPRPPALHRHHRLQPRAVQALQLLRRIPAVQHQTGPHHIQMGTRIL